MYILQKLVFSLYNSKNANLWPIDTRSGIGVWFNEEVTILNAEDAVVSLNAHPRELDVIGFTASIRATNHCTVLQKDTQGNKETARGQRVAPDGWLFIIFPLNPCNYLASIRNYQSYWLQQYILLACSTHAYALTVNQLLAIFLTLKLNNLYPLLYDLGFEFRINT